MLQMASAPSFRSPHLTLDYRRIPLFILPQATFFRTLGHWPCLFSPRTLPSLSPIRRTWALTVKVPPSCLIGSLPGPTFSGFFPFILSITRAIIRDVLTQKTLRSFLYQTCFFLLDVITLSLFSFPSPGLKYVFWDEVLYRRLRPPSLTPLKLASHIDRLSPLMG